MAGRNEWRGTFRANYERHGTKRGRRTEVTVLIKNVVWMGNETDAPEVVTDHVWLNDTVGMQMLGDLEQGTCLQFDARIKRYRKGSVRHGVPVEHDYKLSHPTRWFIVPASTHLAFLTSMLAARNGNPE
jgi:hypothetical protein